MKKMIVAWLFIALVLVFSIYFIGLSVIKEYKPYRELEADLAESATIYMEKEKIVLRYKEKHKIDIEDLAKDKLTGNIKVGEDKCTGYIIVKKELNGNSTKAYIKCENYTTEGYED